MKTLSPALRALIATRQFYVVDLHTFTLANGGGTLRYCSGDIDVILGANTFLCGQSSGILFDRDGERAKVSLKLGLEVSTVEIGITAQSWATINGLSLQQAIIRGVFDGAEYTLQRAYMPTFGDTSPGAVTMFGGRVGEIPCDGSSATITINSPTELLDIGIPRNVYQPACSNTLFDTGCGLTRASFAVTGNSVITGFPTTASLIYSTYTGRATNYFSLGVIQFTSGALSGMSRSIKAHSSRPVNNNDELLMISPFPVAPAIGDTFTLYPGCNKLQGTCLSKFNNLARFRGYPFIPENSTAI